MGITVSSCHLVIYDYTRASLTRHHLCSTIPICAPQKPPVVYEGVRRCYTLPVNDTLSSTPKRLAILSGAALSLATLQFATVTILAYFWFVQSQQPPHQVEWGEGMGAIVFLFYFVVAHIALVVVGLILTLLSLWRREQPVWPRETALAIYGPAALVVVALVIWRILPK